MGVRRNDKLTVIGVPIPGWDSSALNKADSTYTLMSTEPGVAASADPRTKLQPVISGAQSSDIEVITRKAGMPALAPQGHAASVSVRDPGDTNWTGWSYPSQVGAAGVLRSTTFAGTPRQGMCDSLNGQYAFVAYGAVTATSGSPITIRRYDADSGTWATTVDVATTSELWTVQDVCLYRLSSGRLICMYYTSDAGGKYWPSRYSDDNGSTWADYAPETTIGSSMLTTTPTNARARVARRAGSDELIWIREGTIAGNPQLFHAYSSNLGTRWTQVTNTWITAPTYCDLIPLPAHLGGGVLLAGIANGTGYPTVWRIGSVTESFDTAVATTVQTTAVVAMTTCIDADGAVYIFASMSSGQVRVYASYDGGVTWPVAQNTMRTATANTYPTWGTAQAVRGSVVWCHTANAPTSTVDNSLFYEIMGGWSTIETYENFANHWTPTELPGTLAWLTATISGGTTQTLGLNGLQITGASGDALWTQTTDTNDYDAWMQWSVQHVSGSPSTGYDDLHMRFISGDGVNQYTAHVRCSATQVSIWNNTTFITSLNWDTSIVTLIMLTYRASDHRAQAWVRRVGQSEWTLVGSGTLTPAASAAAGEMRWGRSIYSNLFNTQMISAIRLPPSLGGLSAIARVNGDQIGRNLSTTPYPLPRWQTSTGTSHISALTGPAQFADQWTIPVGSVYPADALVHGYDPTTIRGWRGAVGSDVAANRFVFDLPDTQALPRYMMISVLGTNCRYITVEYWNGAAWSTSGLPGSGIYSIASGFTNLSYTRTGNTIRPNGGNAAGRYIQRGDFDGCWVDLGSGKYRKVRKTKQGSWPGSGTIQHAELILDGIDGSEPASGSGLAIHPKSMLAFIHDINIHTNRLRISTDGGGNADGYAEIGLLAVQEAIVPGHAWGWNTSRARTMTRETQSLPDGTTFVRPCGRSLQSWTVDWTDGADQTRIRQSAQDLDWLSPLSSPTEPAANLADLSMIENMLDETRQGSIPVTIASVVPGTSGTVITDRTLFVYGRPASGLSITHVAGSESTNEMVRVGQFIVEELP